MKLFFSECSFSKYIPPGHSLILRSPNLPGQYPTNLRCNITLYTTAFTSVRTSAGRIIVPNKLYFSSNHFDVQYSTRCTADYLRLEGFRHCGTANSPIGILTASASASVQFITNNYYSRSGYAFRVSIVNQGKEPRYFLIASLWLVSAVFSF